MKKEKRGFNLRSFTSFALAISTIVMAWSGFILYVAPPGRIANWGTWRLMLFTKTEWQALHTIFSYLFFILFVIHLFFINWRTFLIYFKSKLISGLNRKWELFAAVIVSAVFFIGTLRSWTPFGPVMKFGEKVKEGWGNKFETPPVIHMETYTLAQVAGLFDSTAVSEIKILLLEKNITIRENDTTLRQIAERNNRTPSEVYSIVEAKFGKAKNSQEVAGSQGQGFGKTSLVTISKNSGIALEVLIARLKENGIEATGNMTLREVAEKLQITPREVNEMLTGK